MGKHKFSTHVEPYLDKIKNWLYEGRTHKYVYKKLALSKSSWYQYLNDFPDFSNSVKKWEKVVNKDVEDSLFKRAIGKCKVVEITKARNEVTNKMEIVKEVTKTLPPDVGACGLWLRNKDPDNWKDELKEKDNGLLEELIKVMGKKG